MSADPPPVRPISRRRLLASLGVIAAGAVAGADLVTRLVPAARTGSAPGQSPAHPTATPAASASPGVRRAFRSRPDISAPLVEITTLAGIPAPGLIFLTPANGNGHDGPTIVDATGELVWMRPDASGFATDFRVVTWLGEPALAWWEGSNNSGIGAGEHVLADASYREILRIPGASGRKADLHELLLTESGTALFFADAAVQATPAGGSASGGQVMDCAVQEVDLATGALRFEWHAIDHVDVSESVLDAPTKADAVHDYFHGNSIEVDTDGNLLVSARNTSAVYKVDRMTGQVIWRLGGRRSDFTMGPGTTFGLQHDVRRQPDGTLTIFDDRQSGGPSRGIVLSIDEQAMTARLVREYRQPQGLFSTSQGNVQMLPGGHVFVGWGSVPGFTEFGSDGRIILDAGFTATQSYRDFRFPWVGRPADSPAIAVDPGDGGGLVVYASWNGSTEVASWAVVGGADATTMRMLRTVPRTGFETVIPVPGGVGQVAVQALDASGAVLGASSPVPVAG